MQCENAGLRAPAVHAPPSPIEAAYINMNMLTFPSRVVLTSAACAALVLSACGGGGGDAGTVASTLDFPLASAISTYETSAHQFNLAGALDGVNYAAGYRLTPGSPGTFEGKPASTAVQIVTLRANGVLRLESTFTNYFLASPYVFYGSVDPVDGAYSVFTQTANLPATARVGQSGALGSATDYADLRKIQITGTSTLTWSLEADSATTALFCLNTVLQGTPSFTGSECYRVNANGVVSGLVLKVNVSGKTLILS